MARKIVVNEHQYTMPKISTLDYLDLLDIEKKLEEVNGSYSRDDFMLMVKAIVLMYGNQFTEDDVLNRENGLSPDSVIVEFSMLQAEVMDRVDKRVEKIRENFTSGK